MGIGPEQGLRGLKGSGGRPGLGVALMRVLLRCLSALALCSPVLAAGGGAPARQSRSRAAAESKLTGVYRIDIARSDKLYSVVAGASSTVPFGEQQRFFIDLAVRLTPPDLLAIERRGRLITVGSSRAPRVTFEADGVARTERAGDGHAVRRRASLEGDKLIFTAAGRAEDDFTVIFAPVDGGRSLRVTRRLSPEQLSEPVVIQTFYTKISHEARWDLYGEPPPAEPGPVAEATGAAAGASPRTAARGEEAGELRSTLEEWVAATNARDIDAQMNFYSPTLTAFYLARNVSRSFVRAEKVRAFSGTERVDVRAEAPEILFREGGSTAVMRFRKKYDIAGRGRTRRGEVVQELRWRRTPRGWKIFSERDVRVIR